MRKYSDKEVGQILAKAADLQSGSAESPRHEGTTLAELQRVANDVGLDPKLIEQAAAELDSHHRSTSSLRANTVLLEQNVSGPISDDTWEDIVTILRAATGKAGLSETGPVKKEWIGRGETQSVVMTSTLRQGRTQLKLLGDNEGDSITTAVLGFLCGLFGSLVPIIINTKTGVFGPIWTFLLTIFVIASVMFATRKVITSRRRRFRDQLNSVLDRVVEVTEPEENRLLGNLASGSQTQSVETPSISVTSLPA